MSKSNIIFGLHAVASTLQNNPAQILTLHVAQERRDKRIETLLSLAKEQGIAVSVVAKESLDRLTGGENHQGVVALCAKTTSYQEEDLESLLNKTSQPPLILILDGVQDPHNLGACFRSADAAGVDVLIAPKHQAVGMTATVTKVASGAVATVPFIQVTNIVRTLEQIKSMGIWIYGADSEAQQTIYQIDMRAPLALVLGAEGKGLRRLTREHCDGLMKIPMRGHVASLNVSVATGICLFEAVRQRITSAR